MLKQVIQLALCLLLFLHGNEAKVAPDYIHPCVGMKSDCFTKAIQDVLPEFVKGLPQFGIEPIDPLRDEDVKVDLPGNLVVQMKNGSMTGLRNCIIESASYKNAESDMKLRCNITIKGKYKATGRILIVSLNGDGDAKIKIKNMIITAKVKYHDKVRDGITYHEMKSYDAKYEYGKVTFALTNLFKGNPELSETVLQFLNQNWKHITEEFGKPLVDRSVTIIFNTVQKFLKAVPKDELFILDD